MANLIPRKQIEEQQSASGSFNIGQDVVVGRDAIFSGSLYVSKSFFLGNDVNDYNDITGSVYLTGSLNIDGPITSTFGIAATASYANNAIDTVNYNGILAKDFGANVPTLYVSSTDGDDSNDGRTIQYPLRTIKRAAQLAEPGYDGRYGLDTGSLFNGYVIKVQAGTYLEDNPVILPKNTSIWGSGLRITKILAKNKQEDLFWVNSGCYVAEVTVGGLQLYPDQINPEKGFGFAFQPGAFITTSPYIQNCSQISNQENSFMELYEDVPPGGGGLYVNGDAIHPESPLASMVLDAYTQISPNGVGCLVNGRGFIQLVSFFNNFSYYAIRVNNGGHATLNNSNISFGLYGMYASGSRMISGSTGGNIDARDRVRESWSVIVRALNKGLTEALPETTILNTDAGIKVTPATQSFLQSVEYVPTNNEVSEITSDFNLITEIVSNGVDNYPALLAKSSNRGYGVDSPYNISNETQITSSISATEGDLTQISSSYATILSIFGNGTGSFTPKSNTANGIIKTDTSIQEILTGLPQYTASLSSSFGTIIDIVKGGLSAKPTLVTNNEAGVRVGLNDAVYLGLTSSLDVISEVSSSFSIIYNILANGTGSNIEEIPVEHIRNYTITNTNSSSYNWAGVGENPTIKLFRGEEYHFYVSASESTGGFDYPFYIRTKPVGGIIDDYNYNDGVVNNGDSVGNITFTVPYDAPNELYYISQNSDLMLGKFQIVNSSTTPIELIQNTLTYPTLIVSGSDPKTDIDTITAYNILKENKSFIQTEVIEFINSSWSDLVYNEASCSRDVGCIVDAVSKDLLYGGNEESIRSGLYYYLYPLQATTSQLPPTLTAVKYVYGIANHLLSGNGYNIPQIDKLQIWETIRDNKEFIQAETIAFLSSSWSGFEYNEVSCSRDIGYILDAIATDTLYGGNERSIEAGEFYYKYPSQAITTQNEQTITGIRYASGLVSNLVNKTDFVQPTPTVQSAYDLLIDNKQFIKDETIQFINTTYPYLVYNEASCSRDVGYIIDAVATDLYYGGNERAVTAGRYYYNIPSVATSTQKVETIAGIKYAKILSDYIVQNIILETPRIVANDEKGIKVVANNNNITSSISATSAETNFISSSIVIITDIIKNGLNGTSASVVYSVDNNIKATNTQQYVSSTNGGADEITNISASFSIVTDIISNGMENKPNVVSNTSAGIKLTNETQIEAPISASNSETGIVTSSFNAIGDIIRGGLDSIPDALAKNYDYGFNLPKPTLLHISSAPQISIAYNLTNEDTIVSGSFETIIDIIANGTGSSPQLIENTADSVRHTVVLPFTTNVSGSITEKNRIDSGFNTILDIIENGTGFTPKLIPNSNTTIKVTNTSQFRNNDSASDLQSKMISSSFAIVTDMLINGTGSVEYVAPNAVPTTNIKINNAIVLLNNNKQFIVDETIAYVSSSWDEFMYNQQSSSIDLGYIIDGVVYDLSYGGNSGSYTNGKLYYDLPSQATGSQLDQNISAIQFASGMAQKVVKNTLFEHISASAELSASYTSLINNKEFIKAESIYYVNLAWSEYEYNEESFSRDIGYIIDAVATDLLYGGNERAITAGSYYYKYPSQATTELQPQLDGIGYAKGLSKGLIENRDYQPAGVETAFAHDLLLLNKYFIQSESIAYVNAKYPNLYYDESKYAKDLGYIVDSVATDLFYGGNERSIKAGEFYYKYPSQEIGNQLVETIDAIDYAARLSVDVLRDITIPTPQIIASGSASTDPIVVSAYNSLIDNIPFIQAETIAYITSSWSDLVYNAVSFSADVEYIVNAVATDLLYGGNQSSVEAGSYYYLYPSQTFTSQLEPTINAINFAKGMAVNVITNKEFTSPPSLVSASVDLIKNNKTFIQNETMAYLTSSWSSFSYNYQSCSRDVGYILDGVVTDLLYGGNERSVMSGEFYYRYPSQATTTQAKQTIEGIEYASRLTQKIIQNDIFQTASLVVSSSADLLKKNKDFIANEVIAYVSSSWSSVYYNEASCSRDVKYIIDAVATDLYYGSNERSITAGNYYYLYPSNATKAGIPSEANQLDPTITGVEYAGKLASKVVLNSTFQYPSQSAIWGRELMMKNKQFIQKETIAFLSSSWSGLRYNEVSCSRDLGFILDAVSTDLIYGGNERSATAGSTYYRIPSVAILDTISDKLGQKRQTADGIRFAKGITEKVVKQTQLVYPPVKRRQAYDRLVGSKDLLKEKAISYTNGAFPYLVYNEASCSRDTGLIVDAVVTDLVYGGNERGIEAASSYYNGVYGSAATVINEQRTETLETNRYLRTRVEFIAQGAPLENFGSLIVATGIDYSYNGSGVTFKALPPNQGGSGVPNPDFEITELGGGRIYFTSGNQDGDFRIGTGLSINQATGTLVGRTFSKSLFSLVTPFSLALEG